MRKRIVSLVGVLLLVVATAIAWMSYYSINLWQFVARPRPATPEPAALSERVEFEAFQANWRHALADLARQYDVDIEYDELALALLTIDEKRPHSFRGDQLPLRSLLHLFLRRVHPELTFYVREGVVWISTLDRILSNRNHFETRIYSRADLLAGSQPSWSEDELQQLLQAAVHPESWDVSSGGGNIRTTPAGLIVTHSPLVHREIDETLRSLSELTSPDNETTDRLLNPSADETRIRKALQREVSCDFDATPLEVAMQDLSRDTDIVIWLDGPVLRKDLQLEGHLASVPLATALDLLLKSQELTYVVRDDVVLITTEDEAATMAPVALYRIGDLFPRDGEVDRTSLTDLVVSTIENETWEDVGGSGTAAVINDVMFVRNSRSTQLRIRQLLEAIRDVSASQEYRVVEFGADRARPQQVEAALEKPNRIQCYRRPLNEGLAEIEHVYGIPTWTPPSHVRFDAITMEGEQLTLRKALGKALLPLGASVVTSRGVLEVYVAEEVEPPLFLSVHPAVGDPDALPDTITTTISPESWEDFGGTGVLRTFGDLLVLSHDEPYHDLIAKLLDGLSRVLSSAERLAPIDVGRGIDADHTRGSAAPIIRIYSLPELLRKQSPEQVRGLIVELIDFPTTIYALVGGGGELAAHGRALVVAQQPAAHLQVEAFLNGIQRFQEEKHLNDIELIAALESSNLFSTHAYSVADILDKYRIRDAERSRPWPERVFPSVWTYRPPAQVDSLQQLITAICIQPRSDQESSTWVKMKRLDGVLLLRASDAMQREARQLLNGLRNLRFEGQSVLCLSGERQDGDAEDAYSTQAYDIRQHVGSPLGYSPRQLCRAVSRVVQPRTWRDLGGGGVAAGLNDILIVRQTPSVHKSVAELLRSLSSTPNPVNRFNGSPDAERDTIIENYLKQITDDSHPRARALAIQQLAELKPADPRVAPMLARQCQSAARREAWDQVVQICLGLQALGGPAAPALTAIEPILDQTSDTAVKRAIYGAMLVMGDPATPALIEQMKRGSLPDAQLVLECIKAADEPPATASHVLLIILSRGDMGDQPAVATLMNLIDSLDPDNQARTKVLESWSQSDDDDLRERAETVTRRFDSFNSRHGGVF